MGCITVTLSRQEAKARLQQLTPGTEEYAKLESALLRTDQIVEVSLPKANYKIGTCPESRLLGGFGSSEHFAIGENVHLKGLPEGDKTLLVKGTTRVQFAHIVTLAGDFYGVAGEAISLPGGTEQEKTERFIKAFNTLAQADPNELRKIVLEIDQERVLVTNASLPHHCYSHQMIEKNRAIKKIKNDIDELLIDNSDHFSNNAQEAYQIGHTLALKEAAEAGRKGDLEGLKRAYAIDAFACHFLTDLFASGHIRNQRGELEIFLVSKLGFEKNFAKKLAGILTGAQHEQDGRQGLNVCNKKGEQWRAYGDGYFFAPKNAENREKAIAATQASADEIYQVYQHPESNLNSTVLELIPCVTPFNPLPLYSITAEKGLVLHQGSNEIQITSRREYLLKGLAQAVKYLPEEYISGFLSPEFPEFEGISALSEIVGKVVSPQIGRLTGTVWHTIGITSYHQIRQENSKLNGKVDELADTVKSACKNTEKILQEVKESKTILEDLSWAKAVQEVEEAIADVQDIAHQCTLYKGCVLPEQVKSAREKLWFAQLRLSRVFCKGTTENGNLLLAYEKMIQKKEEIHAQDVKIIVTSWFRKILDYQVQAFVMYGTLLILENGSKETQELLKAQSIQFECGLEEQIKINKDYIDQNLVCEQSSYIELQLQKKKKLRQLQSQLKAIELSK